MIKERKFRAHYTHKLLELTLKEIQDRMKDMAEEGIFTPFVDPENPTKKELQTFYKENFAEMSDPWEITANGTCKVEEI